MADQQKAGKQSRNDSIKQFGTLKQLPVKAPRKCQPGIAEKQALKAGNGGPR